MLHADILVEAYSPLLPLTDKTTAAEAGALKAEVDKIAATYSKTPAQVNAMFHGYKVHVWEVYAWTRFYC
jgi:diketogulonate reductase-like aldo/keto reductase